MNKKSYSESLNDPRWQNLKKAILKDRNHRCQKCGSSKFLQVHHIKYLPSKEPWEYPHSLLKVLCEVCHAKEHGHAYMEKKCKDCGVRISASFEYCFSCYKKRLGNIEKEKEKAEREKETLKREKDRFENEREKILRQRKNLERETSQLQNKIRQIETSQKNRAVSQNSKNAPDRTELAKLQSEQSKLELKRKELDRKTKQIQTEQQKISTQANELDKKKGQIQDQLEKLANLKNDILEFFNDNEPPKQQINKREHNTDKTTESLNNEIVENRITKDSRKPIYYVNLSMAIGICFLCIAVGYLFLDKVYTKNEVEIPTEQSIKEASKSVKITTQTPSKNEIVNLIENKTGQTDKNISVIKSQEESISKHEGNATEDKEKIPPPPKKKETQNVHKLPVETRVNNVAAEQADKQKQSPVKNTENKSSLTPVKKETSKKTSQQAMAIKPLQETNKSDRKAEIISSDQLNDIHKYVGKKIIVKAKIDQISTPGNGNIYLNIGGKFPDQKLALVIFQDDARFFKNTDQLENKSVEAFGQLSLYKNRPQIILNEPNQLNVITAIHSNQSISKLDNITAFIGKNVSLTVKIEQTSNPPNGTVYLNIGGKFPNQKLSLVIFKDDTKQFQNLHEFEGKVIEVNGKVTTYKNSPQIIIKSKNQINIL